MNEIVYKAIIELNPRTKKNSQNIVFNKGKGKPFIIQNERYKLYEKECSSFLPHQGILIDYPVNLQAVYYRQDKRRVDLANLHEALLDILVKYNIIEDDNSNIIASMDGSKVQYDKENPRTEIIITKSSS